MLFIFGIHHVEWAECELLSWGSLRGVFLQTATLWIPLNIKMSGSVTSLPPNAILICESNKIAKLVHFRGLHNTGNIQEGVSQSRTMLALLKTDTDLKCTFTFCCNCPLHSPVSTNEQHVSLSQVSELIAYFLTVISKEAFFSSVWYQDSCITLTFCFTSHKNTSDNCNSEICELVPNTDLSVEFRN